MLDAGIPAAVTAFATLKKKPPAAGRGL